MTDKKQKIAILHDAFLYRGGGERLVTLMAKSLDADLISGFFSDGSFDPRELGFEGRMIPLGKPVFMKSIRHMILKWRFISHFIFFHWYDTVIFSWDCLEALWHIGSSTKKVYYCHTPPRYLYDFREKYLMSLPFFIRPIFRVAFWIFRYLYEFHLSRFDHIFTNSQNVHDRLLSFCWFKSEILYPPTDVSRFISAQKTPWKDYFLSFARLSPPKRVDLIVDAFLGMPNYNLVFTYGRNDPMKEKILRKIEGKKNIIAIESPNDDELISLIQWATATIYIPVDEDFGMSPVESMACGTPVIGVDEGWLRETIIEWKTGKLISIVNWELWIENLKKIIQNTKKEEWSSMSNDCIVRARDFSLDAFEKKLKSSLQL
jgi:glycosyltransferase involved in cell wall biosynthesis